jgi:hypothetical protein
MVLCSTVILFTSKNYKDMLTTKEVSDEWFTISTQFASHTHTVMDLKPVLLASLMRLVALWKGIDFFGRFQLCLPVPAKSANVDGPANRGYVKVPDLFFLRTRKKNSYSIKNCKNRAG